MNNILEQILNPSGWVVEISIVSLYFLGAYAINLQFERGSVRWWVGLLLWFGFLGAIAAFIRTGSIYAMFLGALLSSLVGGLLLGGRVLLSKTD